MERYSFKKWHPFLEEWVVFAPTTSVRPWSGSTVSKAKTDELPAFDPGCYLCPGVKRASGKINPDYKDVMVFDNDFASFSLDYIPQTNDSKVFPAQGKCRVICFSPKHNLTLAEMQQSEIKKVILEFCNQYKELSEIPEVKNVMIFENKGTVIGVSNPHPHGQVYATDFVPRIHAAIYGSMKRNMDKSGECLMCNILKNEISDDKCIVTQNKHFAAFVPSFARHTFETYIVPKRHISVITELNMDEIDSLAEIYREMLIRYDNLFEMPFPNITILRNAPSSPDTPSEPFHFFIEFCPPLRSHDKLKYMAGFETGGGNIINPSVPGESAQTLKSLSNTHYLKRLI